MQRVPRYTSYPTAVSFSEQVGESRYAEWLTGLGGDSPLSLYVHLPFCRQLCWFCGCNMRVATKYDPIKRYLGILQEEARLLARHINNAHVVQIHFGGGSRFEGSVYWMFPTISIEGYIRKLQGPVLLLFLFPNLSNVR